MKRIFLVSILAIAFTFSSCDVLKTVLSSTQSSALTESDIVSGLKSALEVGVNNSVSFLGKTGGFTNNAAFKIPFPEDVKKVETAVRGLGAGELVDNFIGMMNKGAENAVAKAAPIFVNAIKSMSIADAKNILKGGDNAATTYFKSKTQTSLNNLFKPEISKALDVVNATKYWSEITTMYNKIPLVKQVNTDLPQYVTTKAIDALFVKIGDEEKNIRTNASARVNDILKKVFNPNAIIQ